MAGVPIKVVENAAKILTQLESVRGNNSESYIENKEEDVQLSFFKLDDPILEQIGNELNNMDVNTLTPMEALIKLNEIKKLLGK